MTLLSLVSGKEQKDSCHSKGPMDDMNEMEHKCAMAHYAYKCVMLHIDGIPEEMREAAKAIVDMIGQALLQRCEGKKTHCGTFKDFVCACDL